MTGAGIFAPVPASDSDFYTILLARLCKLPREFFSAMPAKDYAKLTQKVSSFLLL